MEIPLIIIGLIFLVIAGMQDLKTRKPMILIPSLIIITYAITNIIPLMVINIIVVIILFIAYPNKLNEKLGSADTYLLITLAMIMFFTINNILLYLLIIASMIILIGFIIRQKRLKQKQIPIIYYYALSVQIEIIIIIMTIISWVIINGF